MDILSKEHIALLKLLINSNKPLSSSLLSVSLGISQKTIRSYLETVQEELDKNNSGATIVSKSGTGIYLSIDDKQRYKQFYEKFSFKYDSHKQMVGTNYGDTGYLIRKILNKDDGYITIDQLVNELYKSRKPLIKDLKNVENFFDKYHIKLDKKAGCGIKKEGSESHVRIAMADSFMMTLVNVTDDPFAASYAKIKKNINSAITKEISMVNISIAQKSIDKIGRIIFISASRYKRGILLENPYGQLRDIIDTPEYYCARNIYNDLNLPHDEKELQFLTVLLITRRSLLSDNKYNIRLDKESCSLADEIVIEVNDKTGIDFSIYPKFKLDLARHIRGLRYRLTLGLEKRSFRRFKHRLKDTYFELSVVACMCVERKYNVKVPESEVYYFSYIFQNQTLLQNNNYKSRVLVSSIEGKEIGKMISEEIVDNWSKYIDEIEVIDNYIVDELNPDDYDLLVTDSIYQKNLNIHCIYVNSTLGNIDFINLKRFFETNEPSYQLLSTCLDKDLIINGINLDNKKRLLDLLCTKINSYFNNDVDTTNATFLREQAMPSEVVNSIAVVHSFTCFTDSTKIAILVLNKAINWNEQKCKAIVYVANGKNEKIPFSTLSVVKEMIVDGDIAQAITENEKYEIIVEKINFWLDR